MDRYEVTGMSCAACSAAVERAVKAVPGVTACSVNLLTNDMGVEGSASSAAVIAAVEGAGYGAVLKAAGTVAAAPPGKGAAASSGSTEADAETARMKKRLIASLLLLIPLMYPGMGHMLLSLPLPGFLEGNPTGQGLLQLVFAALIMEVNRRFFINGFRGALRGSPNMDTLVALGSGASFVYSLGVLFSMTAAASAGADLKEAAHGLYFESAGMILTLITVGKTLEARAKGKTTDALRGLMDLAPKTAVVLREGREVTVPAEELRVGDLMVLRPGERIPADGIVKTGFGAVNEAALTGESIPVEKLPGSSLSAATINVNGALTAEVTRVGEDTALSQIIRMVSEAAATKAPIARLADRVSGWFVPGVLCIALVTFIGWLLTGAGFAEALTRGVAVLVISCPCALGLATPVAIMVGSGMGAKNGILFKTSAALEQTGRAAIIVLDKTGTITAGEPRIAALYPTGCTEEELLRSACALEQRSEHPLAKAVMAACEERGIRVPGAEELTACPGSGLIGRRAGQLLYGGSEAFVSQYAVIPAELRTWAAEQAALGRTILVFSAEDRCLGAAAAADPMKPDSAEAVKALQRLGLRVALLTGDRREAAEAVARQAGIREVYADVRPDGKAAIVRTLQKQGVTVMVGDGINDAPALTAADVGMAIGAGTEIAMDAADVVLMKSSLLDAAAAIRLSRKTLTNIRENLFWAFAYNVICIPLAAGCYTSLLGWTMSPMIGAAAMSLSSFCVVSNALRLNLCRPRDGAKDRPLRTRGGDKPAAKDHGQAGAAPKSPAAADTAGAAEGLAAGSDTAGTVQAPAADAGQACTLTVRNMMCHHCEGRVEQALLPITGVLSVKADFETGRVTLVTKGREDLRALKKEVRAALKKAGYPLIGIEPGAVPDAGDGQGEG